jgi:1-acyl-sn-glycerol-3-phosphate acyltransferase
MAKAELFNPVLAPVLRAAGAFPVRRGELDVDALETAVRLAREGKLIGMFPEGTRRAKGLHKRFEPRPHTGSAWIALKAGVPLVPAAIEGTEQLSHLHRLEVTYGEPVTLDDLAGLTPHEGARVATDRLMAAISRLRERL